MPNRARVSFVTVAVLLLGCGVGMAAPASPPPPPAVRIDSLTQNARGSLSAGSRITVMLRGSAGGSATFHIFGVATDIGMREIRTGVYQAQPALYIGTYIVRPGDAARNAALFATLTVRGTEVTAASARPVTIDTRPPAVISHSPKPATRLTNARPNIVVTYVDAESGINPGAIRLSVNGQDVTARASITEAAASYTPDAPFPPGPVRVQAIVVDQTRNATRADWSFLVAPSDGLIYSVTINPAAPLRSGDILTVVMTGAPGGTASFAIQGLGGTAPMRESRTPGLYLGSYAAGSGVSVLEAPLLVTLEKGGRRSTAPAAAGVTILSAPPPAPTITSPGRAVVLGQEIVTRLILRGRSRPGFRILGRISYGSRSPGDQGVLGEFLTVAGNDGTWQAAIGPLIPFEGARLFATVVAIDPAGQRSPPTVLELNL